MILSNKLVTFFSHNQSIDELILKWQNFILRAILSKYIVGITFTNNELAEFYIMATSNYQPVMGYRAYVVSHIDNIIEMVVKNNINDIAMTFKVATS